MKLLYALRTDIIFQVKNGFYTIYCLISIVYIVLLSFIPRIYSEIALPYIIFTDPSVIGFFFIGGILMLEKVQGVLDYTLVTPLSLLEYLSAKTLSLSLLSITTSLIISFFASISFNPVILLISVLLVSSFFTLVGFTVAIKCNNLNQYFVKMVPYLLFLILPCISITGYGDMWLTRILPGVAGLRLILGAFNGINLEEFLLYGSNLIIFISITYYYIHKKIYSILYGGK